jgi:hypothetical protein
MPSLRVSIDGTLVASVCTDGLDQLGAHVSGTRVEEELATLYVAGGSYPDGASSTYLIWVDSVQIKAGQEVAISLVPGEANSHRGKTIEELSTGEAPPPETDFEPHAKTYEQLRQMRPARGQYRLQFASSIGRSFVGQTAHDDHGFSLTVHWNSFHPERARISLDSYTLEALETRGPMNDHVEARLQVGDSAQLRVDA